MEGNNEWIQKLMEGDLSPEEKDQLFASLDEAERGLFEQLDKIKTDTDELAVPAGKSKEDAWESVMEKITEESYEPATRVVPFYQNPTFVSWVAASVAVLVGVYFFFNYFGEKHYYVPNSHMEAIVFPDESEATLNAHSRLIYNKRNFYKDRKVDLQGEAFFEIKEGEPFEVTTNSGAVFVLGTKFNVLVRDREFQVKCLEGKVKVVLEDMSNSIELGPGQATRLSNRKLSEPYTVEKQQIGSWINGEYYFNSDPLSLVVKEMERQFDVQIKAENLSGRTYTGHFSNKDFNEALKLVFEPMGMEYDVIDKRLVIVR